jgi:RNA polymerase sigma factor for flagellar operon FliA
MQTGRKTSQKEITGALWRRYAARRDPETRDLLLEQHLGLVHHLAREIAQRSHHTLELEDLIGAGTVGLVQAVESFDPSRGLAFSSFAVPRIRGAILDELRSWDWVPRSVREKSRALKKTGERLRQQLGREPEAPEMAEALGVDQETYWRYLDETKDPVLLRLDSSPGTGCHDEPCLSELIPDRSSLSQDDALMAKERMRALLESFGTLSQRDRLILTLSYYEKLTLQQIGEVLHITESRVSQLRSRALKRLGERIHFMEEKAA